jgi:transcriptional antiterminator RfaH
MKQWYALHTDPRVEKKVARALCQHGIETFLPKIATTTATNGRGCPPLFPGYLFACIDLSVEGPARWRRIAGVRYIVSYGDWPVPVPDEIICLLRRKLENLETEVDQSPCQFKPGDLVRISNGPFKEMLAIFDGPITPRTSVRVLLFGLNSAARLRLQPTALEKVAEAAASPATSRQRRTRGRGRYIKYKQ